MNYAITCILPLALLVSGCDGSGGASTTTTTSGRAPTHPQAGSAPAQRLDPDEMMKRPPIGDQTAPATANTAAPMHP